MEKETQQATEAMQEEIMLGFDDELLSASERQEIALWKQIISEWRTYRHTCGLSKEAADDSYIELVNVKNPDLKLTRRSLYRKWSALNDKGDAALIDRRGKHGKHAKKHFLVYYINTAGA